MTGGIFWRVSVVYPIVRLRRGIRNLAKRTPRRKFPDRHFSEIAERVAYVFVRALSSSELMRIVRCRRALVQHTCEFIDISWNTAGTAGANQMKPKLDHYFARQIRRKGETNGGRRWVLSFNEHGPPAFLLNFRYGLQRGDRLARVVFHARNALVVGATR